MRLWNELSRKSGESGLTAKKRLLTNLKEFPTFPHSSRHTPRHFFIVFGLFTMPLLSTESGRAFSQRFGEPGIHQYKVGELIRISIETDEHGAILGVLIVPARHSRFDPDNPGIPSRDVVALLSELLPGITSSEPLPEPVDRTTHRGFITEVRRLPGALAHFDYRLDGDRALIIASRVEFETSALLGAIPSKIQALGPLEYEQYSASDALAVGVSYAPAGGIASVQISAKLPLLTTLDEPQFIDSRAAESLLNSLFPEVTRAIRPTKWSSFTVL